MSNSREMSQPVALILALFMMASITVSFIFGYTTGRRFTACPATAEEARELFGGRIRDWQASEYGWAISLARALNLVVPYGYARIVSDNTGQEALFGAASDRLEISLSPNESLRFICPQQ